MQPHDKPTFSYIVNVQQEKQHLAAHLEKPDRKIPARTNQNVLIVTWNMTNFGAQQRQAKHLQIMAEL